MLAFQPVRFRAGLSSLSAHSPTSTVCLFLPHYTSLFYSTMSLYPAHSVAAVVCARHRSTCHSLASLRRSGMSPFFSALLFSPPFSLLTLSTKRRVLVFSCCGFDTFTPATRFTGVADELKLTQLACRLDPRRGRSLLAMARHKNCVHCRAKLQTTQA